MALKATVFRAELNIADMNRGVYQDFALTLARHPSENDERMMVRLLAFALEADERLTFGAGLSTDDEPALWRHSLDGRIERWIDVGLPEPKRIKQALGRAETVRVFCYGETRVRPWWDKHRASFESFGPRLELLMLSDAQCSALANLAARTMQLSVSVQDDSIYLTDASGVMVEVQPRPIGEVIV